MGLEITVTHLTRMRGDRICVAGLTDDAEFVRPDCAGNLRRSDVPELFGLGARVDLGPVRSVGAPPQVENVDFVRQNARRIATHSLQEISDLLERSTGGDLEQSFGAPLLRTCGGALYLSPGTGTGSLATIRVGPGDIDLVMSFDKPRGRWLDPRAGACDRPATDLRLYPTADGPADRAEMTALLNESQESDAVYLSVGLSKAYAPPNQPLGHWLQLNNVLPIRLPPPAPPPWTKTGWPQHSPERFASLQAVYPAVMAKYARAWAPWNDAEDEALIVAFERGEQTRALAERHERKPGAISSRLKKLGLT